MSIKFNLYTIKTLVVYYQLNYLKLICFNKKKKTIRNRDLIEFVSIYIS